MVAQAQHLTMAQRTYQDQQRKRGPLEGWDIPIACLATIVLMVIWAILAN